MQSGPNETSNPADSAGDSAGTRGIDRTRAIIAELAEALGGAAAALACEQRARAAREIEAVAEAARCAAHSLDESGRPGLARSLERAVAEADDMARDVREGNWRKIGVEAADFARRRPGWFGLGALSIGFVAGRLLFARPAGAAPTGAAAGGSSPEPADCAQDNRQAS